MKRYKFNSDNDVAEFIQSLVDEHMVFHLDDDPEDIEWRSRDVMEHEVYLLKLNMIDLWKYCDPWEVMAKFPSIEKAYMEA